MQKASTFRKSFYTLLGKKGRDDLKILLTYSNRLFFCWIFLFFIPLFAYGGIDSIDVKVEGAVSLDGVHPGSQFQVAVLIEIPDGWHINTHIFSSEDLIPTVLRFEEEPGLSFGEVVYPSPVEKVLRFSARKLAMYEGRSILGCMVAVSKDFPTGKRILQGKLSYQACNDQRCLFPTEVDIHIPIQVVGPEQSVHRINCEVFSQLGAIRADAYYALSKRYYEKGALDKAISACKEAIKWKPDNLHYFVRLAELYHEKGDYTRAIATIKNAIALEPDNAYFREQLRTFNEAKEKGLCGRRSRDSS